MTDPLPFELTPYSPSMVRVRMPDGSFKLVGVHGRPFAIRTPTGWRTFPNGDGLFVRQRMPDGSWAELVWSQPT